MNKKGCYIHSPLIISASQSAICLCSKQVLVQVGSVTRSGNGHVTWISAHTCALLLHGFLCTTGKFENELLRIFMGCSRASHQTGGISQHRSLRDCVDYMPRLIYIVPVASSCCYLLWLSVLGYPFALSVIPWALNSRFFFMMTNSVCSWNKVLFSIDASSCG